MHYPKESSSFRKALAGVTRPLAITTLLVAIAAFYQNCSGNSFYMKQAASLPQEQGSSNSGNAAPSLILGYYTNSPLDPQNFDVSGWQYLAEELHGRGNTVAVFYFDQEDLKIVQSLGVTIRPELSADRLFISKLQTAKRLGFKVIVQVPSIFFLFQNMTYNPATLRQDYRDRWAHFKELLNANNLADVVVGLYVFDEPYWNAKLQNVALSVIKSNLESINAFLQIEVPNMKRFLVEAYTMIDDSYSPPNGFDLVGFDCYGSFDACGDKQVPIIDYFSILKSKLKHGEKIILVPDAFVFQTEQTNNPDYRQRVVRTAQKFVDFAKANSDLIGAVMPFLYETSADPGLNHEGLVPANRMAEVIQFYDSYFQDQNLALKWQVTPLPLDIHIEYTDLSGQIAFRSSAGMGNTAVTINPQPASYLELTFVRPYGQPIAACVYTDPSGATQSCMKWIFERTRLSTDTLALGTHQFFVQAGGTTEVRKLTIVK